MAGVSSAPARPAELSWFSALCDDDCRWLGVPDADLAASWSHCRDIVLDAEQLGYDNILLPSGYELGIDGVTFAAGIAPQLRSMKLLLAVRCAEMWPPQLARQLASLAEMLRDGPASPTRLTVNIISSDLPGAPLASEPRYARSLEVMTILRTLLSGERVVHHGEFYDLELDPPRISTGPPPPFYFGGMSEPAKDVAARAADVYLMWPDTEDRVGALVEEMTARAAEYGRHLRFGYRSHVVVRPAEDEARAAAFELLSRLDADTGDAIRSKSLDTASSGVGRQQDLRGEAADDGFVEDHLWTGIGRARSGCGAAIVGDPAQVWGKLEAYRRLGIDHFILSGYPHRQEARYFADLVMPLWAH